MNLKVLFILTMLVAVASSFLATELEKILTSLESLVNIDELGKFVGGDMRLREDQEPLSTNAKSGNTAYRWTNGIIPYYMDPTFTSTEKDIVRAGMTMIENCTCIRFKLRLNEARYLKIQRGASGTGCWSDVGCQPDRPTVTNLQYNGCIYSGICAHEFCHAIGAYHQQSRWDRDSYVRILWENIDSTKRYNFDKYSDSQFPTYGIPYDCSSIMHYSSRAFSINGNYTIDGYNCGAGGVPWASEAISQNLIVN